MARAQITFEDTDEKSVSIITEISGCETLKDAVSPAMALATATRALFENGILAEAAGISIAALSEGKVPSECLLHHFNKSKAPDV